MNKVYWNHYMYDLNIVLYIRKVLVASAGINLGDCAVQRMVQQEQYK